MSATIPRDLILDAVAAALGGMGIDPYLYQRVPVVMRHKSPAHALTQLPSVIVAAGPESYTMTSSTGVYHRSLSVSVLYVTESQAQDEDGSKIVADIETALADTTLGGKCNDLLFESNTVHISDSEEPLFFVEVQLRALYRTATNAPLVRV
jgi:hypothetical protein